MKKSVAMHITGIMCALLAATATQVAQAGNFYVYKDQNGSTLLTNRPRSDRNLTKVKVTYYPDSNIHSYSNWGSTEAAVAPSYSRNKNAYDGLIRQAAQQHGVAEGLIKAVMHTESGFNMNARSPVGAQGLMQLMPATARRFNVSNAFDPEQNIYAGAKYLSWLMKRFNGNTMLALAAYNAGEGNVSKYGGIPPFRETQDYVRRVTSRLNNLYSGAISLSSGTPLTASANTVSTNSSVNNNSINTNVVSPLLNNSSNLLSEKQVARYQRNIVSDGRGNYTDVPAGSYTTTNASATARLHFD